MISFGTNNDLGILDISLVTYNHKKRPRAPVIPTTANIVSDQSITTTPMKTDQSPGLTNLYQKTNVQAPYLPQDDSSTSLTRLNRNRNRLHSLHSQSKSIDNPVIIAKSASRLVPLSQSGSQHKIVAKKTTATSSLPAVSRASEIPIHFRLKNSPYNLIFSVGGLRKNQQ